MEKISKKSKVLILNFPNNPTGAVMRRDDLKAIADIVIDHDLLVISDEVYCGADLRGAPMHRQLPLKGLWERTITLNGFSKAYAMTGWRIGYLCAPREICDAALKIHQYVMLCAPAMGQIAALEPYGGEKRKRTGWCRNTSVRRNLLVHGLNRIGLSCHVPEGAFYAFPSVEKTGLPDLEFAERLLKDEHVAVVPGSVLGQGGENHIRCAYAVSRNDLSEAIKRMAHFIASNAC